MPRQTPSAVSGDQTATQARQSKNRPCDACRRRKSRCVIDHGAAKCVLCDFHDQDCTFLENVIPRKRKSIQTEDNPGRLGDGDSSRRRQSETSNTVFEGHQPVVQDYAELQVPTLLKRTLGLQRRHHGLFVGSSGPIEMCLVSRNQGDASHISSETTRSPVPHFTILPVGNSEVFAIHSDSTTLNYDEELADLDAIENHVSPNGRALIDLYFRIVHPSFPILHKKVYLEKYARTHREFSPVLLAAAYILALNYWSYSPELSTSAPPDSKFLEARAMKCMSDAIHRPKLSTVEAGLLLLQQGLLGSSAATPVPWLSSLTAQMVAAGQELGLHRDCSRWKIPEWEKGLRKRLAWALYMQDKWASLTQGRPSLIFEQRDWVVRDLVDRDFPENFDDENDEDGSTEVEIGKSLFVNMVSLTKILSEIMVDLYSAAAEDEVDDNPNSITKFLLAKAKPLQMRLREWHAQLPDILNIEHIKFRKLSSNGYLHLAYWATELTLHRRIVRSLATCVDPELVSICQKAASARASSAISFVGQLRPEHWQSFWYFASEYNLGLIGLFEALLASTLTSSPEDLQSSRERLEEYLWTLKLSRKTADFVQKSITMIELTITRSKGADFVPKQSKFTMSESRSEGENVFGEDDDMDFDAIYDEDLPSLSPTRSMNVFCGNVESIQSPDGAAVRDADLTNIFMS